MISSPQTPSEESFVLGLFSPARSLSQGETSSADVSVNYLLVCVGGRGAAGAEGSRCSDRRQCLPLCSHSTQPARCSATWRRMINEFLEVVYSPWKGSSSTDMLKPAAGGAFIGVRGKDHVFGLEGVIVCYMLTRPCPLAIAHI